jgi:uncharacterized protein YaiL (DUF2058 family)
MSLRDQLVAKGFASKKKAKAVERELKQKRKQKQGKRRKKKVVAAEARSAAEAERAQQLAERRKRRLQREEAKAQMERALRVRHLLMGNQVRAKGPQPFWHRSLDGRHLLRMSVSHKAAEQLRAGQLAVAGLRQGQREDYWLVPDKAAEALQQLAPALVVHFVQPDGRAGEPEFGFLQRDWETDLRPHRARAEPTQSPVREGA